MDVTVLRLRLTFVRSWFLSGTALAIGTVALVHSAWVIGGIFLFVAFSLLAARIWILRRTSSAIRGSATAGEPLQLTRMRLRSELTFMIASTVVAVALDVLLLGAFFSGSLTTLEDALLFAGATVASGWAALVAYYSFIIRSIVLATLEARQSA